MSDRCFDLRSDTVTQPSPAMREVMARAPVGDDVYREDPSVKELEARTAEIVGKEAALFVPSGTMANQIAMLCLTRPGDEVIVGRGAHCAFNESGAGAAWSGVQFEQVGDTGIFDGADVEAAIKARAYYYPNTSVVVVENTHNRGGGLLFPRAQLDGVVETALRHGLKLHLDGARIWNAAVKSGTTEKALSEPFDTVSVCFSKGLGAPVGSAICGSATIIRSAVRFRKMLGGGMRQAGILAAGALYALEHNRGRIAQDHDAAQRLGDAIRALGAVTVGDVHTNIVNIEVPCDAERVVEAGRARNVLFSSISLHKLRLVTHLDVSGDGFDECIARVVAALGEALT